MSRGKHRAKGSARTQVLAIGVSAMAVVLAVMFGTYQSPNTAHADRATVSTLTFSAPQDYVAQDVIVKPKISPMTTPSPVQAVARPAMKSQAVPDRVVIPPKPPVSVATSLSGTLSCTGLERLWDSAGGNPAHAFVSAEIAKAESGGRDVVSPPNNDGTVDRGYWQINSSHGSESSLDPLTNARAAIIISGDGTDWNQWTTYRTGAYIGKC